MMRLVGDREPFTFNFERLGIKVSRIQDDMIDVKEGIVDDKKEHQSKYKAQNDMIEKHKKDQELKLDDVASRCEEHGDYFQQAIRDQQKEINELKDATYEIQQLVQDQADVIEELKQIIENYQTRMLREEEARHQKFEEKLLEEIQDQVLNTVMR
jgi:methyl-accepting chemotaxis protein